MSEFKEWFKKQYYCYSEEEYAKSAWNHQQAKIDELQKRVGALSKRLNEAISIVIDDLEESMRGEL